MEIQLTPEQEARLAKIARDHGTTVNAVVLDYAMSVLDEDSREREIIQRRIEQADRGVFLEEEEMSARVVRLLQQK